MSKRTWKGEPFVLFVEGYSDLHFYAEMLEHLGLHKLAFIQDLGGNGRPFLMNQARLLLKPDNLEKIRAVAVIYDSDGQAENAFNSARRSLRDAVGVSVQQPGAWHVHEEVAYGIFVAGTEPGQVEMESVAWQSWMDDEAHQALGQCVESYIACAEQALARTGGRLQSPDKVRIGALLAAIHEDDPRLGPATQARKFDLNSNAFASLREFFEGVRPRLGTA